MWRCNLKKIVLVIFATALVLGLVGCRPDQQMSPPVAETAYDNYAGSEACAGCHSSIYNKFIQSGHPYKLTKVVNGQKPLVYPFTSLPDIPNMNGLKDGDNSLGRPDSYGEVSYVIGGYNWKARFVDLNGYIITGSDVQYNYETGGWVSYHNDEVDKPYDCGKCHTTGWIPVEDGAGRKDNLPGMDGNFFVGGVHCEECHGPGAAHVNTHGDITQITKDSSAELCGRCHTRDSQNRIAASGGYIKHHEQYDELLGLDPDNMAAGGMGKHLRAGVGCNSCHDPHTSTVHELKTGIPGVIVQCESCHADKVIAATNMHSQQNLEEKGLLSKPNGKKISNCLSCHMPKLTKSAVGHAAVGGGPAVGDIKTHIFKIDLSKTDQFTDGGSFAYPWLTTKTACKQCHNGEYFFELPVPVLYKVHTN
jgi:Doubled CXXCH motif (Paired_CXXCH_1)/Cytochrome c554 and c-prime